MASAYERILRGLKEATAYAKGDTEGFREHHIEVKETRSTVPWDVARNLNTPLRRWLYLEAMAVRRPWLLPVGIWDVIRSLRPVRATRDRRRH